MKKLEKAYDFSGGVCFERCYCVGGEYSRI